MFFCVTGVDTSISTINKRTHFDLGPVLALLLQQFFIVIPHKKNLWVVLSHGRGDLHFKSWQWQFLF